MKAAVVVALGLAVAGLIGNPTSVVAQKKTPAASSAPASAAPTGANQFSSEGQAKSHCPSDVVVWVNLSSKVYHFSGNKDYGKTKRGAYVCEKDATAQGFSSGKK